MKTPKLLRLSLLIAAALGASGCGVFKKSKAATPVLGQRIAVLTGEGDVAVDPATTALPMTLPDPVVNPDWTQSGGNAAKSMGHLALGGALTPAFTVQGGRGSTLTARLAAAPIVAGGRIYVIDTLGTVRAFDARTGATVWASQTPAERATRRRSTAAGSPTIRAESTRPTVSVMSPRSASKMGASSGRFARVDRCAGHRRSRTARSTS